MNQLAQQRRVSNARTINDAHWAEINNQLEAKQLKVRHASVAVIDDSIISSAGAPLLNALEVNAEGEVSATPTSKDSDAKRVKKAGQFYLGYKRHACCDSEGYLEALTLTTANAHESQHLAPLLDGLNPSTE